MSEKRGIFSLEEFYDLQVSGETSNIFDAWKYVKQSTNYGYFGGGISPSTTNTYLSTISRLDFSNDYLNERVANFAYPGGYNPGSPSYDGWKGNVASMANGSFGYFAGGTGNGDSSEVLRYDFANDDVDATLRCQLTKNRYFSAATGNLNFGYIAGTYLVDSSIDRIDYDNDTANATPKGNLNYPMYFFAAAGNLNYGYYSGGSNWPAGSIVQSYVQRLDYANDSVGTSPKGHIGSAIYQHGATGNSDYGWHIAGYRPSGQSSVTYRIDYSNDTATAPSRGAIVGTLSQITATGNSTNGWTAGGYSPSYTSGVGWVFNIDYSNDTANATPAGALYQSAYGVSGMSPLINGFPEFTTLTENGKDRGGQGIRQSRGYFAGGFANSVTRLSSVFKIDFANDTSNTSSKGPLPNNNHQECGGESSGSHGYVICGSSPSFPGYPSASRNTTNISRISYANDSATAVRVGNFLGISAWYGIPTDETRAIGNPNFAYFINAGRSQVNRLDYSNDTDSTTARGFTNGSYKGATIGNSNFGYFIDSYQIQRLDYSNDTAPTVAKGSVTGSGAYSGAGTGNSNFGYITANGGPSGPTYTTVQRVDYSNDTAQTSIRGPLAEGRIGLSATGDSDFGYFGGGYSTYPSGDANGVPYNYMISSTTRIDYANDTNTTSPKGNIASSPGWGMRSGTAMSSVDNGKSAAAFSPRIRFIDNQSVSAGTPVYNYAYFGGGDNSKMIIRLDYANDTDTPPSKGNLETPRQIGSTVSNANYGYFVGGRYQNPSQSPSYIDLSSVDRIDYSNDTAQTSPKGSLSGAATYTAGTGNLNYGYIAGNKNEGNAKSDSPTPSSPGSTKVQRIDYANDTETAVLKGPLANTARFAVAASGNLNYAWFSGGRSYSYTSSMSDVDRLDLSSDTTTASQRGNLANSTSSHGGTGTADYGYHVGGRTSEPSSYYGIQKLDYGNDTINISSVASIPIFRDGGATGNRNYGYFSGRTLGYPSGYNSSIYRYDFSNESTNASTRVNVSPAYQYGMEGVKATSALINGFPVTLIDGARDVPYAAPYNSPVQLPVPVPSGPAFAYFAGGSPGPGWNAFSGIDRIQYSNDTATASPKGALTASKYYMSGCGTKEYGYIGGGGQQPGPDFSSTDRIDYSNDTATALARGPLDRVSRGNAAASNTTYGYWAGGMTPYPTTTSRVSRLTFASDTAVQVAKGNLTTVRRRWHATGNQSYGYFAGGSPGGTRIDRIDYTNDTPTAASKGPLSVSRSGHAASGNASFGYFINGFAPGVSTSVDRLDYSSDTTTASPKGPLTSARAYNTGTGSPNFGYVAGGWTPSGQISYTDRIEYSNDTATSSPKGTLNSNPYRNASVSSQAYGLPG